MRIRTRDATSTFLMLTSSPDLTLQIAFYNSQKRRIHARIKQNPAFVILLTLNRLIDTDSYDVEVFPYLTKDKVNRHLFCGLVSWILVLLGDIYSHKLFWMDRVAKLQSLASKLRNIFFPESGSDAYKGTDYMYGHRLIAPMILIMKQFCHGFNHPELDPAEVLFDLVMDKRPDEVEYFDIIDGIEHKFSKVGSIANKLLHSITYYNAKPKYIPVKFSIMKTEAIKPDEKEEPRTISIVTEKPTKYTISHESPMEKQRALEKEHHKRLRDRLTPLLQKAKQARTSAKPKSSLISKDDQPPLIPDWYNKLIQYTKDVREDRIQHAVQPRSERQQSHFDH